MDLNRWLNERIFLQYPRNDMWQDVFSKSIARSNSKGALSLVSEIIDRRLHLCIDANFPLRNYIRFPQS